ncbi:MAG: hypothetical protein ACJ790_02715 [Myxococcaceae bacterium]
MRPWKSPRAVEKPDGRNAHFGEESPLAVPPIRGSRDDSHSRYALCRTEGKPLRIDLHRHLEGSHSPEALVKIAQRFDLRQPLFWNELGQRFRTAAELRPLLTMADPSDDATLFYECIKKARAAYVSAEAIGELSRMAFDEAALDSPDGFEMRVSLFSMTRTLLENEKKEWRTIAPAAFAERARELLLRVLSARDASEKETGVEMLLRLGFSRTFESEPHYRALGEIVREHAAVLSGLDVLGIVTGADKEPMPPALVEILQGLRNVLPDLTVHAGEFEGHAAVDRTLELKPQAIGHGVHSVQSEKTLAKLASEGVTVEVCPVSNALLIPTALARLKAEHGGAHPLSVMQQAHIHCVLGSDDPTPMGTTYQREWRELPAGVDAAQLERDIERRWKQLTA